MHTPASRDSRRSPVPIKSAPSTNLELADLCVVHPKNNVVLAGHVPKVDFGHRLSIKNGSSGDAIIKVRNATSGQLLFSFFAFRSQTAEINNLSDGAYKIQFAFGDAMTTDCKNFRNPSASEFPGAQTLRTRTDSTQITTQVLSFTLYSVPGGNVRPQEIDASAFNAD